MNVFEYRYRVGLFKDDNQKLIAEVKSFKKVKVKKVIKKYCTIFFIYI